MQETAPCLHQLADDPGTTGLEPEPAHPGKRYTPATHKALLMNIRSRLIVLVLSVLLPAFAAGGMAVWFVYAKQLRAQEESIAEASRVLAQLVDNELESSEYFLKALTASPDLADGNLERFYQHIKLLSNNGQSTLILSSPEGQQLLNTRLPFGSPPRTINPQLLELRRMADPYRTIVSDLFLSPLGKRYDFAVQVPVVINDTVRYYMSRGVAAIELQRFLNNQGFPASWVASVTDRQGTVIARTSNPERFVGKTATGALLEKILQKDSSGINEGVSLEGQAVKGFFHRAPKSEWTIILSVPSSELMRPALHASLLLAVLTLLVLLGALLLTHRYVKGTLIPIQRLRSDAGSLGQGKPVEPYVSGLQEFDEVSATLSYASLQIREAKTELERRVAEAIDSTERAQRALLQSQKLEALGRLTGGVAHDFNNVLQTLTSSLQLIQLEARPEKIPERIATCEKAIARAASLVAQLRAFGRIQEVYQETIQPDDVVMSIFAMLESTLPRTITLTTRIDQQVWPITVDRTQLELALLNLVMNGRDAITEDGVIDIQVSNHVQAVSDAQLSPGDYVRISVSDNGEGMSPEVLSKAFDPFFTTKSVDKGSGLGLPQAYGFAIQSKGMLVLKSNVDTGTTATLLLPRARTDSKVNTYTAAHSPSAPRALQATILFVEDDPLVQDSVLPILENTGAKVLCACNGEEALRILGKEARVDVLFTDIIMPGPTNGLALAKHARENYPGMAIVLATGYFSESIDLPDARLLTKPYQANEAVEMIAEALREIDVVGRPT